MKLAEALMLRADQQRHLQAVQQRLQRNGVVQEGDEPAENPNDLLVELEATAAELTRLIQQINRTNSATELTPGQSVADALAARDVLRERLNIYRMLATMGSHQHMRTTRSEIKYRSTIDVAAMQKQADDLAKAYRELDAQIQAANWLIELIEPDASSGAPEA